MTTSTPRCTKCNRWMTEAASGIFYCTTLMCPDSESLIKRSDTGKFYTMDEIINDKNLPAGITITDSYHEPSSSDPDDMWSRSLSTLNIYQDKEHGFYAQDDCGSYSVDIGRDGRPYMTCAPLYNNPDELWTSEEWGEPAYGQIESVDEVILKRIEQVVIPAWIALGRPRTYCMDESDRYEASKRKETQCEHCAGPLATNAQGDKYCPKPRGSHKGECFYGLGEDLTDYTYTVTIAATGDEEAKSFLLGCHENVRSVERAVDPSGKWFVDEADEHGVQKHDDPVDNPDYIECEICGKPGTPPDYNDFVKGVGEPGPTHKTCWSERDVDVRIDEILEDCIDAFFVPLGLTFPEIKTGDFSPHDTFMFEDAAKKAARAWVYGNLPQSENPPDEC